MPTPISKKSREEVSGRAPQRCSHFLEEENTFIVPSATNAVSDNEEDDDSNDGRGAGQHQLTNPVVFEPIGLSEGIAVHCL